MNSTARAIQQRNEQELALGIHHTASWHDDYKASAYIFVGNLDRGLTEGDIITVFSQYGEIVDLDLLRDEKTGISRGFCYLAYEDQRSTNLAIDNFNGIDLCGRIITVDHKLDYFKKEKKQQTSTSQDTTSVDASTVPAITTRITSSTLQSDSSATGGDDKESRKKHKSYRNSRRYEDNEDDDSHIEAHTKVSEKLRSSIREETELHENKERRSYKRDISATTDEHHRDRGKFSRSSSRDDRRRDDYNNHDRWRRDDREYDKHNYRDYRRSKRDDSPVRSYRHESRHGSSPPRKRSRGD